MKSLDRNYIVQILIILLFSSLTFAQVESSRTKIAGIIEQANCIVGVAVMDLDNLDTLTVNDDHCYPMQSTYKFPLALAVLSEIDKGNFSLDQTIHVTKEDLLPNTWSPLREKYPEGNVDITLREILEYTVSISDNNGCDILFRLMGGPNKVQKYINSIGINEMSIVATEEEMHKDWDVQYKNCSTPSAMMNLLFKFSRDSILSTASKDFLWDVMTKTVTGPRRIKGNLPEGTVVAHKTGSSGVNDGIAAATNDVGIVSLPDGRQFAIVVFVSDSPEDEDTREKIIADIVETLWDAYLNK